MASLSGTELSDEKEAEIELKKRQRRPWDNLHKSSTTGLTPELPETLGFYDISAVRREQRDEPPADPSLTRFICTELTRGYFLEHNEAKYTERRERVYTCMRIPKELEKKCVPTGKPRPMQLLLAYFFLGGKKGMCVNIKGSDFTIGSRLLQPAQVCDMLRGLILVLCFSMMHYVDYSMMYHLIRGQSVIKLYIIYNMLEVADRLFSSFGQDILDALYWTATEPKERKRDSLGVIPHFFMAVFYVFLHAILIMVQASTLNVAFNSHNKSLLTIMMSNNFVEIKGSVFKKFEKNNLFQMSNSDIKERFTSYILLLIVCLRNMEQFSWNPDHLWVLFPDVFMVVTSEVAVDVIKHAFITKFNDITADACTDYSDSVARRMGFIPLPLAVLLIRVVMSSLKVQGALSYTCVFLCYLGLVTLKVLNSIVLLGKSCLYVKRANMEDKLFERPSTVPEASAKSPSKDGQARCRTPSGESKVEHIPATPCRSPSSSSSSVTTQPTPRTDLFPAPPTDTSPAEPVSRPPTPPPESEQPMPTLFKEEEEEEAQGASELKHRTTNKDLLDIDRFTICGNRID
ncbi:Transmembrane anterior posterior transformation protein 1 -like protein [Channa argus]|uniref:Transmembrane anterior posterior transformation protein 1-like protein n=1 Tax=Channa argus TaxID=215402 RepID=A0A6G1PVL7_CHAAH|nr:Transmembrane anterior posterior transformation protein 1 -like protein [Channa argus]